MANRPTRLTHRIYLIRFPGAVARTLLTAAGMLERSRIVVLVAGVAACGSDSDVETTRQAISGPVVVINEFTAGNAGKIEIYNVGDATANLSNWQVDDIANGGTAPKSLGTSVSLAPGASLVVAYSGINTASADDVRLVDAGGVQQDIHNNFYAGSSITGLCFGRRPDGGAWATQAIPCSLGTTNGCSTSGACDDGNACTTGETIQANCTCGGGSSLACDDANPCTADGCDPQAGCSHAALPDGSACGTNLICQSGACVALPPDAAVDAPPDASIDASPDAAVSVLDAYVPDAYVPPPPPPNAELLSLPRRDHVLLQGVVVTPDQWFTGEVLVEGDTITCVAASCSTQPGALDAAIVRTNGLIFPGMIDTHNHILFDIFDETDWSPSKLYTNHNQWTSDPKYKALVDAKQYMNGEGSPMSLGCEMDKYGELKALIAGTTSVQGSANPADKACYGSLARTIDQSPNGLSVDKVQTASLFPQTSAADAVCNNFATDKTDAYVIHIAEGVDQTARNEFAKLGTITTTPQCLYAPQTTIIHGTALGDPELSTMAADQMSLVWSPRSNVFLYGLGIDFTKTANIPLALAKGINVALAPDWSIGGSQNLLDELRFADLVDNAVWSNTISPHQLVDMVTINAARSLGLGATLGSIEVGKKADLMVIGGDVTAPYDALLRATPRDVRLVMVGGVALYGDAQIAALGPPAPGCDSLGVCSASKFVCVAQAGGTATNKLGQSLADVVSNLTTGMQSYDALDLSAWNFAPIAPLVKCP